MKTKMLLAATVATATAGVATATAIADRDRTETRSGDRASQAVVAAAPQARAAAAAVRVGDLDADLLFSGRVRLEAETRGASRVTFTYGGRSYAGRTVEIDREDGTRDWARTVRARSADRNGGRRITIRARACAGDRCVTRTSREFLAREDDD